MGAAGTGAGQAPNMPQGVNPQLLQMLMQMQAGGGQMGQMPPMGGQAPGLPMVQPPPNPMTMPQGSPMANYIGAGGNMAGMMQHPMGMPQNPAGGQNGQGAQPGVGANPGQAAGAMNPNLLALIQAMRGGQTGVGPYNPSTGLPNAGQLANLTQQAAGNTMGGAPGL